MTPGGVAIHCDRTPPPIGQELRLHLSCAGEQPLTADLFATVRWSRPWKSEGSWNFGVEFAPGQLIEETREVARMVLFHCD